MVSLWYWQGRSVLSKLFEIRWELMDMSMHSPEDFLVQGAAREG